MTKWTMSTYWGTDDSRGMSGTVNEYGYDFSNGKTVMTADDGYAYSKEDFGIDVASHTGFILMLLITDFCRSY